MTPGIYNISFDEYTAIDAISNTALGKFEQCPAMYQHWRQNPDDKPSPALKIGRIAHRAILEPDKFEAEFTNVFATQPETYPDDKTGEDKKWTYKAGYCKRWRAEAESEGREVITHTDEIFLAGAAKSIAAHPIAAAMLHSGAAEQSIVTDYNGVPIKARVDFLTTGDTLIDLKTTCDASPREFQRDILNYRYYRQAAFYLDACKAVGLPVKHFCILAVEKTPPYLVACYRISKDYLELGRREYVKLLGQLVDCQRSNKWPGYSDALIEAKPPEWKLKELPVPDPAWMTEAAA